MVETKRCVSRLGSGRRDIQGLAMTASAPERNAETDISASSPPASSATMTIGVGASIMIRRVASSPPAAGR
jgi:hypothetical protein